jgi:zinc transporter
MYFLSLVAAVFLPLDFLTGLLAAFGGIPGQSSPWGFSLFSAALIGCALALVVLFRREKWFRPIVAISRRSP